MDSNIKEFIVKEQDIDLLKHVNYQVYLTNFEKGRFSWFESNGIYFNSLLERGITFVLRHLEVSYIKEARLGDKLIVKTRPGSKGKSSFTMKQTMFNQRNQVLAESKAILVMFNFNNRTSIPVIDEICQLFESKK